MKRLNLRIVFVFSLSVMVFSLIGSSVIAQEQQPVGRAGWQMNVDAQVFASPPPGPPAFSVIPVDGPEDIPLLQQRIQEYIVQVQLYVAQLLASIFGNPI